MKRYSKNKLAEALCRLYLSVPESCMEDFEIIRQGIIELNEIREALTFESLSEIASDDGKREVYKAMGCDIHIWAEVKKDGKWEKVGKIFKNPYYKADREENEWNTPLIDEPYSGRNYDLFAILANVRNGSGFAGCDTGEGFNPISYPRGVPENASPEYKKEVEEWDSDGHSHSYLFLQELLDYDWHGQKTIHRGLISEDQYENLNKKNGKPDIWWGDSFGTVNISSRSYENILTNPSLRDPNVQYNIQVSWEESYYESACHFVDNTIPALEKLGRPSEVRIVFFFDN